MKNRNWLGRAAGAALLAGSLGACDYLGISDTDPNIITDPTLASLFVSAQVNSYVTAEGQLALVGAVWTQQLAGADRQYAQLDVYENDESTGDNEFAGIFTGGGLVDIRNGRAISDSVGCPQCSALFQIHEAFLIGSAASIFGDLPYRGALVPGTPAKLDPQAEVYKDVQALLDGAIAGLSSAPAGGATAFYGQLSLVDFNFGGNRDRWTAVANTLKARYYLHWVEAQRAGGAAAAQAQIACQGDCIAKAAAAAQAGITAAAGDLRGRHSTSTGQQNFIFQFFRDRAGYAVAGQNLVNLLNDTTRLGVRDPRRTIYFAATAGNVTGSSPGEFNQGASVLSTTGYGASNFNVPIVTCVENFLILAEVRFYQAQEGAARQALANGVGCAEKMHNLAENSILTPTYRARIDAATGQALLAEVMTQKYISLFLNLEVYNDYKRTCLPALKTFQGRPIPGRLLYGQQERQTNPNIPAPDQQPRYNANDPVRCS
ncbi:MAG: SusD/RagB family nutrient-binding outer membrane lipoprotein [Gemmatimonadetes bacterium]|nr:SusD/RagB family nutrient-binding outer membrane lipoprotein [Gemmatimonadota bacterium]